MKTAPTVAEARAARQSAENMLRKRTGQLIKEVIMHRGTVPRAVAVALRKYEDAIEVHSVLGEAVGDALHRERTDAGDLAESKRHARVSALIAGHVMRLRLAPTPERETFKWVVLADDRTQRPVPSYTTDHSAIAIAAQHFPTDRLEAFGASLAARTCLMESPTPRALCAAAALASPLARALAMLEALGVDETEDPPLLVR